MFNGNETVTALLKTVFSERPIQARDFYLTSALMEVRRAMADTPQIVKEEALGRSARIPPELRCATSLPPWEAELLSQMFLDRPVILVQGGSGCGKTSALSFIRHHCRELNWTSRKGGFGYNHALLTVDLQDQADYLKKKIHSEDQRQLQSQQFLAGLVQVIDAQLEITLTDEQLGVLFSAAFLGESTDPWKDIVTRTVQVKQRVKAFYKENQLNQTPTWKMIQSTLDKLDDGHDRVVARYLILKELANLQLKEHGRRLVLAIDNIDPFPEYLQTELIRTLETIAHGSAPEDPTKRDGLSVVIFARLSTSTRHSGTLDGVSAHRVHFRAPDPAELVFFKLSSFLLNPKLVGNWNSISPDEQEEIIARAWFLWERLANPKSQFSEVLSGLAGTNSRTACKLAIWWLTSPRIVHRMAKKDQDQQISISRPLCLALLLRSAHAVARGIRAGESHLDLQSWEKGIVESFFANLLGIMIDNRILRRSGSARAGNDVRTRLSQNARKVLMDLLQADEWQILREAASAPVAEAVYDRSKDLKGKASSVDDLSGILARGLKRREEELRPKLKALESEDSPLAQALCQWLCDSAVRGAAAINRHAIEGNVGDALRTLVRLFPSARSAQPNRWEAVSILVSPESQDRRTPRSALNLFSADGNRVSPVALHVLCYLEEQDQGLQGVVIRERLRRWGFTEEEMMQALMDMVNVDRRLIYCGVKDFANQLDGWFDTYHEVRISSAGSGYLTKVAATPAYLQWALLEPRELHRSLGGSNLRRRLESGLGRLRLVLDGLKAVRNDELKRAQKLEVGGLNDRKSLSPIASVFFPSLRRFIKDISSYKSSRSSEGREVAEDFMEFAASLQSHHLELFGTFPRDWEYCLIESNEEVRERFT